MKKIFIPILSILILAACGQSGGSSSSETAPSNTSSTASSRQVDIAPSASSVYQIEHQTVDNNGKSLVGDLYRPQIDGPVPLVIFSHELGNTRSSGRRYAEFLAERGVATYIFDFAGGSPRSESDGDTHDMSIMTEVSDLEAVLQASQSWDFVNHEKVTLLGASQGGVVSSLTAVRNRDRLAGLILLYPAYIIPEMAQEAYASLDEVPEEPEYLGWFDMGRRYVTDIWDLDIYQELTKYEKPVLLMHGTSDSLVPVTYSERASQAFPQVEFFKIEGAGHSFTDGHFDQVSNYIWDYLTQQKLN